MKTKINKYYNYKKKFKLNRVSPVIYITSFAIASTLSLTGCNHKDKINIEKIEKVTEDSNAVDYSYDFKNDMNKRIIEVTEEIEEQTETNETLEEKEKKIVAITFDDGPSKYTSKLVDILNKNDATATFFLVGDKLEKHSDAVVKAYTNGNEIAIHSYSHTSFEKMTIDEIKSEIDNTRNLLDGIDVEYSNLIRPPYGAINENIQNNIDSSFILWNVDTRDWESRNKDAVIKEVKENIDDGCIILFHDMYESSIDAVAEILPELSDEYEFVSVSELFKLKNQPLEINKKYFNTKK